MPSPWRLETCIFQNISHYFGRSMLKLNCLFLIWRMFHFNLIQMIRLTSFQKWSIYLLSIVFGIWMKIYTNGWPKMCHFFSLLTQFSIPSSINRLLSPLHHTQCSYSMKTFEAIEFIHLDKNEKSKQKHTRYVLTTCKLYFIILIEVRLLEFHFTTEAFEFSTKHAFGLLFFLSFI